MSMILDALRKSDRERARAAADRLREGPAAAAGARPGGAWWLAVLLAVIGLGLALLVSWPDTTDRTATGEPREIMENEPAPAPVRELSGELPRAVAPREVTKPPPAPAPEHEAVVENLAVPPMEELPPAIRIRLPSLQVNIHAWSENPQERFVLINLRRYQEGDRLQEGLLLHRIVRDGVVLEFEGTLFFLPRQ